MKNFEAYESKIEEFGYNFAVKKGELVRCIDLCSQKFKKR